MARCSARKKAVPDGLMDRDSGGWRFRLKGLEREGNDG